MIDKYEEFVVHPRFGRQPHITGLNVEASFKNDVHLHWHSPKSCQIANTAIPANLSRQTPAIVPVTHYYDVERQCQDCCKPFIFFAKEQRHWYEVLGFSLDSDCVRCVPCRKRQQGIARTRERYEELFHVRDKSEDEIIEMADCCLSLVESEIFTHRQTERVRMLLNMIQPDAKFKTKTLCKEFLARVCSIEKQHGHT